MNPLTWQHHHETVSNKDLKCFTCKHFLGTNEAGDIRCKKEIKGFMNYRDRNTIVKCKANKWFDVT